jgi:hypothetical protein
MGVLYEDDALGFGDAGDLTSKPSSELISEPPGSEGIGLTAPEELRYPSPELISEPPGTPGIGNSAGAPQEPSTMQKIGRALYNYGAGYQGQPSYGQVQEKRAREKKEGQLAELKGSVAALEHGSTLAATMAEGDEKAKFIKSYSERLDAVSPGLGEAFTAIASKPGFADQVRKYADKSPSLRRALEIDPTGKTAFGLLKSADAQNTIQKEMDASVMPTILKKGQTFLMGWQQLVPPDMVEKFNKDGRISASELIEANEWIKTNKPDIAKTLALSDEELGTVHRNSDAFYHTLGIISPKDEGQVLVANAKGETRAPPTRIQPVNRNGVRMDQQQEWVNGEWKNTGDEVPHFAGGKEPGTLTASQERTNAEIDGARTRIEALTPEEIKRATQSKTSTGADNPAYDPRIAADSRLAMRKKFGEDKDFEKVTERISGQNKETRALQDSYDNVRKQLVTRLAGASGSVRRDIEKRIAGADAEAKKRNLIVRKTPK